MGFGLFVVVFIVAVVIYMQYKKKSDDDYQKKKSQDFLQTYAEVMKYFRDSGLPYEESFVEGKNSFEQSILAGTSGAAMAFLKDSAYFAGKGFLVMIPKLPYDVGGWGMYRDALVRDTNFVVHSFQLSHPCARALVCSPETPNEMFDAIIKHLGELR